MTSAATRKTVRVQGWGDLAGVRTVALVPARGGSRGVPRKNVRRLCGLPLIAHTVRAALGARAVDAVFVSTDSPEIAAAAARYGARVPWLREAALARDDTPMLRVVEDFLRRLDARGCRPDRLVLLQPTSPLRSSAVIDRCLRLARRAGAESAATVCRAEVPPWWLRTVGRDGRLDRLPGLEADWAARQQAPAVFRLNGAVYLTTPRLVLDEERLLADRPLAVEMPVEESVDIDTPLDWAAAVFLMRERRRKRA